MNKLDKKLEDVGARLDEALAKIDRRITMISVMVYFAFAVVGISGALIIFD